MSINYELIWFNSLDAPKLNKNVKSDVLPEGTIFTATCAVYKGSLPLFFQWSKDGQTITKQTEDLHINAISKTQSVLTIEKLNANDSGNYTCSVRNAFGFDSHSIALVVRGKDDDDLMWFNYNSVLCSCNEVVCKFDWNQC